MDKATVYFTVLSLWGLLFDLNSTLPVADPCLRVCLKPDLPLCWHLWCFDDLVFRNYVSHVFSNSLPCSNAIFIRFQTHVYAHRSTSLKKNEEIFTTKVQCFITKWKAFLNRNLTLSVRALCGRWRYMFGRPTRFPSK